MGKEVSNEELARLITEGFASLATSPHQKESTDAGEVSVQRDRFGCMERASSDLISPRSDLDRLLQHMQAIAKDGLMPADAEYRALDEKFGEVKARFEKLEDAYKKIVEHR